MFLPTSSPVPPVEHRREMLRAQRAWHKALYRDRATLRPVWRVLNRGFSNAGDRLIWQYGLTAEFFADPSRTLMMAAAASVAVAKRGNHADIDQLLRRTLSHFAERFAVGLPAQQARSGRDQLQPILDLTTNHRATTALNEVLRGPTLAGRRAKLGLADPLDHFDLVVLDIGLPAGENGAEPLLEAYLQGPYQADFPGLSASAVAEALLRRRSSLNRLLGTSGIAVAVVEPGERPLLLVPALLAADAEHPITLDVLFHEVMHTVVDLTVPGLSSGTVLDEVTVTRLAQDSYGYVQESRQLKELELICRSLVLPDLREARTPERMHARLCADLGPRRFLRLMELGSDGFHADASDGTFGLLLDAALHEARGRNSWRLRDMVDGLTAASLARCSDDGAVRDKATLLTAGPSSVLGHLVGRRLTSGLAAAACVAPARPPAPGTPRPSGTTRR